MRPDLDQYFTPESIARGLIEASALDDAKVCLDSACGDGSLLRAATETISVQQCIGMDVDGAAIRSLRRRHPTWTLAKRDALQAKSWMSDQVDRYGAGCDLAALNPPFSLISKKTVSVEVETGGTIDCSVAMAHVLTVLIHTRPRVCCAIVPESLLYSDTDAVARDEIRARYRLRVGRGLKNTTFRGARANATIIRLERRDGRLDRPKEIGREACMLPDGVELVRGGLPVFEARSAKDGLRFVHSTEIGLVSAGEIGSLRRVAPLRRGLVSGYAILLPRVGIPSKESLRPVRFEGRIQLSDCVFAISFRSAEQAENWRCLLLDQWNSLLRTYRGTGARYTTVRRLEGWMGKVGAQNSALAE